MMKIKDLIIRLLDYNMDAEVCGKYFESVEIGHIDHNGRFDKKNTPLVFIQGCDLDTE